MTGTSDAEAFREAIIGASLELGQAYGEDGVTMRAIAGKLGTSATTLYTCFESKAAIMRELRLRGMMSLGRSVLEGLDVADARECLIDISRRYLAFARDNPWLYTLLLIDESPTWEVLMPAQSDVLRGLERDVTSRFFERFVEFTGRRPVDARRIVVRWWAGLHGLAALVITRRVGSETPHLPVGDLESFVEEYVVGIVDGLAVSRPV